MNYLDKDGGQGLRDTSIKQERMLARDKGMNYPDEEWCSGIKGQFNKQ